MAKKKNNSKKKAPVIQLSPENYIRKKSRNLPVYKCLINKGWDEYGQANIFIQRKHVNGNVTVGIYLIDTFCLGVKDSFYNFNVPEAEMDELIERFTTNQELIEVDYPLVHNIIWAAVEYAEDYGFKPHKDFERTTQFFLDEDTDDVPLMEIECGKDGKPFFVASEFMTGKEISRALTTLERTAGPGNFHYMLQDGENFDDEDFDEDFNNDFDEDFDEDEDEEFDENEDLMPLDFVDDELIDRWKALFLEKMEKNDNFQKEEKMAGQTFDIIYQMYEIEIEAEYDTLEKAFQKTEIVKDVVPDEFLGVQYATNKDDLEAARDLVLEMKNPEVDIPALAKKLKKVAPNLPVTLYFQIKSENFESNDKKVMKYLESASVQFPDYPLFSVLEVLFQDNDEVADEIAYRYYNYDISSVFNGRKIVFHQEAEDFLSTCTKLHVNEVSSMELYAINMFISENEEFFKDEFLMFFSMSAYVVFNHEILIHLSEEDAEFKKVVDEYVA